MNCVLAHSLLSRKSSSNERLKVTPQQVHAFLYVVNSIITKREANYIISHDSSEDRRNDKETGISALLKDVEELATCLNSIPDNAVSLYPDASQRIMNILAFANQRVIRQQIGRKCGEEEGTLSKFLRRSDVSALVNATICGAESGTPMASKKLNETDWMAVASLVRLSSLHVSSFTNVIGMCPVLVLCSLIHFIHYTYPFHHILPTCILPKI